VIVFSVIWYGMCALPRQIAKDVFMTTLPILTRSLQKTNIWLRDINYELSWSTFQRGYLSLRAVLHALRDRLTVQESAQFAAQLPIFIRGIYYEGWNPARTPLKSRGKGLFLRQVRAEFAHTRNPDVDAEHITRAIFRVLSKHISKGELDQIKMMMPREVREFWPQERAA
jgi:uncharacterized protein (DUF2267 family)